MSIRLFRALRQAIVPYHAGRCRAHAFSTGADRGSTSDDAVRPTISTDGGSHKDFGPIRKAATGSAHERISKHLKDSKVVLYMKGSPTAPACGFSWKTVQVLGALNVPFKSYNVLEDDDLRSGIKEFSAWPTVPQLYVDGEFVGGSDIVEGMARSGELQALLRSAGVSESSNPELK